MQAGLAGWIALLGDMADYFLRGYTAVAVFLAGGGLALHLARRRERPIWIAGLLPVLALVSFTLCFNFTALRTDGRFLLPQAVLATIYIGIAARHIWPSHFRDGCAAPRVPLWR